MFSARIDQDDAEFYSDAMEGASGAKIFRGQLVSRASRFVQ